MKQEKMYKVGKIRSMLQRQATMAVRLCALMLVVIMSSALNAQVTKITVTGTVVDQLGEPLIGATVAEKSSSANGTMTDFDGKYTLSVASNATLTVSYIGYTAQEIAVNGKTTIDVKMTEDGKMLEEVVVTALGIKREKKALGYALQEIGGDKLLEAKETNVANALSGKISGLQVVKSSGGAGGSSKIQLRGNTSVTGLNQPLIVVDGVPMDNFVGADNNDFWNPATDLGSGLGDIASEDIQSMSVLKGASAAALYGARAGNGVILITTKSGVKNPGLGISVSSTVGLETVFMSPKLQNSFGQGSEGIFNKDSRNSWGPKIEGQEYTKWNGEKANMRSYDNLNNYVKTGVILTENVSFSQQYGDVNVYTSLNRVDEASQVPGSELKRTNLTTRALSKFGQDKRWTLDVKVQYINANAENRPLGGNNDGNVFRTMYSLPRSMDIRDFKNHTDGQGELIWYGEKGPINPYWSKDKRYNQDVRERFIMHGSLKYQFTDWLNAEIKAGSDLYNTDYTTKLYAGSPITSGNDIKGGQYSIGKDKFFENNYSFLMVANKDNIFDKIGGSATFGGNLMMQRRRSQSAWTELLVPDLFSINNSWSKPNLSESDINRKMNSLYGMLQVNYGGWLFLDGTFRNDWTSTLSKENRSFFYPSVSTSWVISDWLNSTDTKMPEWFSFAKVRASYAQVGNDMEPYQLHNVYNIGTDVNGNITASTGKTLFDKDVRSELIKSWEVGTEMRFLNNRFGIDFAWYKDNATRQLINLPMDPFSGYEQRKINAGDIQNTGIEIMLNASPVQTASGFNWDIMFNFSKNKNTVKDFVDGVPEYDLLGHPFDKVKFVAVAGGNYGEIWGTSFARVEDKESPYYGRQIVTEAGLPMENTTMKKLGDQQPKAMLGLTNSFSYKGWALSFLIDARLGGEMYSATNYQLQLSGSADVTAPGGERPDMIVNGVVKGADGKYTENTKSITQQQYWVDGIGSGNMGIAEANVYDATNVRLRNLSLAYTFNKGMLKKTPFQNVKVGFTVNNLWMIKSHLRGIDPESVYALGTNASGYEGGSAPTSRSYMVNVTLGF